LIDSGHLEAAADVMRTQLEKLDAAGDSEAVAQLLATLSRAYMRLDMNTEAVDAADRALNIAEAANLELIVTEAFINKGSALSNLNGRRREAAALLQKAVEMASAGGFVETELRGRNNLSAAIFDDNPGRALAFIEDSVEIAQRLGQRGVFAWQTGTRGLYAIEVGRDWDAAVSALDDLLQNETVGEADRIRLIAIRAIFQAARGEIGRREIEELAKAGTEPQTRGLVMHAMSVIALADLRLQEAIQLSEDALEGWQNYTPFLLPIAFLAAVMAQDQPSAERIAKEMAAFPNSADVELGLRDWMDGSLMAMNGRPDEGMGLIRSGVERLRAAEAHWSEVLAILTTAYLFPGRPEVEAWLPIARETFERLRAQPFIALLDARDSGSQAAVQPDRSTTGEREATTV